MGLCRTNASCDTGKSIPVLAERQSVACLLHQVNMFFLCASLRSLYRVTVGRFGNEQDKKPLIKLVSTPLHYDSL